MQNTFLFLFSGIESVKYSKIPVSDAESRMLKVRKEYGSEGEVMYFMDGKKNVIGLLKKKTAWYILARAIREKASAAVLAFAKDKSLPASKRASKCEVRLKQIQTWLGKYRVIQIKVALFKGL